MPPSPPTTLGRYTLLSRLGAGGMGEVWRAHDANLDREVAVKLLNPGAVVDQTSRDRFRREAHVLSRLSHPGVATIYDFDSQGGVDFLVMELVTGGTLEARIAQGALTTADITRIGAQIADARGHRFHRSQSSASLGGGRGSRHIAGSLRWGPSPAS